MRLQRILLLILLTTLCVNVATQAAPDPFPTATAERKAVGRSPRASTATTIAPPTTEVRLRRFPVTRGDATLHAEYCGNGAIGSDTAVRRLVMVVHGSNRNACDYAGWALEAATEAGELHGTLVVAPRFTTGDDLTTGLEDTLYWSKGGWKSGSNSLASPHPRPFRVPSFTVVDEMIAQAKATLPNLEHVVVAGHSAGGQFTNRYAAGASVTSGTRFVVANPSSYLYLDSRRWDGTSFHLLDESALAACPGVDNYKYGLQNLYAYMRAVGVDGLRAQYGARTVHYLLGERDTSTTSSSLDTTCSARWQGPNRLERGLRYHEYLGTFYGGDVHERHRLAVVPGVAHDARAMLTSDAGREALFG